MNATDPRAGGTLVPMLIAGLVGVTLGLVGVLIFV